jgi:hypothetical protein
MTEALTPAELRAKAERYRDMVRLATDERIIEALRQLANEYDAAAEMLEKEPPN